MEENLNLSSSQTKSEVFNQISNYLNELNLKVTDIDDQRPWGGFFVIDESVKEQFIQLFF